VSSYSSLLTSASPPPQIKSEDENYPFRYSKDQLLRVWKDGGGRGGLGLEVERWPGIVREVGGEPQGVKEMTPDERKVCLFTYCSCYALVSSTRSVFV
jgi:PERQ amino acid-rich with GYF domain-containing protein